jgi:UDP-glucose 4-epimerase
VHVVVVGATGNVGSSLVRALSADSDVERITGVARRPPTLQLPKVRWRAADITADDLVPAFRGADAVVHLAWAIQPSRNESVTERINVAGSRRVFDAVAAAGVPNLVYASSVGAYSPGPRSDPVSEAWATDGISSSFYSRHKAAVERMLDAFEAAAGGPRVVRLRPALTFKRGAATEIRRLFLGPFFPNVVLRRGLVPFVPVVDGLAFQAVHTEDVAEAYRLALQSDVHGALNVAAEPVLSMRDVAELLGGRGVRIRASWARRAADLTWRGRLQPTPPGWLDMGMHAPTMSTKRIERELGWRPRRTARRALAELLDGLRRGADDRTPPLSAATSGPLRGREVATGLGARGV